ncbi:hypothetical protein BBC46_01570 (plasmid) [Salmonella enterica]|nr:hypothetical protein BBC46_01570 [Salmonella enterica]
MVFPSLDVFRNAGIGGNSFFPRLPGLDNDALRRCQAVVAELNLTGKGQFLVFNCRYCILLFSI